MSLYSRNPLSFAVAAVVASLLPTHAIAQAQLEEVIVTAQRKAQDLSEVPIAVTAYSAEGLKAAAVDDLSDLNLASPSFMATPFLSDPIGNAPVRIRGIGTGGGNPGFEGAVGLYVDDVYRSRTGSAMLTFFDMAGVEILRGPQGTLFGKNTTAGALLMRTAAPDFTETYGSVTAELGNYGQQMIEGMINVPLGDTAALRVAAIKDEQDGWFQHPVTGEDTFWIDNEAIRVGFAFQPSDTLSGRITLDYSTMESPGNYGTSTRLDNLDSEGNDARQDGLAAFALNLIPGAPGGEGYWYWDFPNSRDVDPYSRDIAVNNVGTYELKQYGVTANLDWDINDTWTLRSITGYRDIQSESLDGDWDFGPVALAGGLDQVFEFETFSQEFLLSGDLEVGNGRYMEITTGFNYFTEDIAYERRASPGVQFAPFYFAGLGSLLPFPIESYGVPGFNFQDLLFDQKEDSYGVFAHVSYELSETFTLIGGLRYNRIDKEADTDNRAAPTHDAYHDLVVANAAFFYAVGAGVASPDWDGETGDEEWTYLVTGQYRPNDDNMFYASYSRGFKAGGFNLTENARGMIPGGLLPGTGGAPDANGRFFTPAANPSFGPEFVDAYELGWKWEISAAARLSATIFYSDYEDLQVSSFNGLAFEVANAGTSTTQGLELEFDWALTDELVLTGGATFLEAEYGDDTEGFPAGRQRGQTPEQAIVLGVRYNRPLGNSLELYYSGNVAYNSEMFLAEGTSEPLRSLEQDAYTVVSSTLGLRGNDRWDLALFCNNCFDEDYYEWGFNQPFQNAITVNPAPPQTYGARFTVNF